MTLWSLGLRSEKYIITSQHEDLVHLVLFLLDTELPGYGCWLAVDDLDGEHAGLSCCVGKRIVPGKFWASHPRQTLSVGAQDEMRSYHSWTSAASLKGCS